MRTYTPFGKAHRMLARLEEGPAPCAELRSLAGPTTNARRKGWRVIGALREDRMAHVDCTGLYGLTQAGMDALACLRSGKPVVIGDAE